MLLVFWLVLVSGKFWPAPKFEISKSSLPVKTFQGAACMLARNGECTVWLTQVAKKLELAHEALRFSYNVFENYGNMSSPSVLFVLRKILDSKRPQPGQKGMLLALINDQGDPIHRL